MKQLGCTLCSLALSFFSPHLTPHILASHLSTLPTTPANQEETAASLAKTPASHEQIAACQEETPVCREETPASQEETSASQEETSASQEETRASQEVCQFQATGKNSKLEREPER